jgi:hypothetical protein
MMAHKWSGAAEKTKGEFFLHSLYSDSKSETV